MHFDQAVPLIGSIGIFVVLIIGVPVGVFCMAPLLERDNCKTLYSVSEPVSVEFFSKTLISLYFSSLSCRNDF